jgi:hypothetical protein
MDLQAPGPRGNHPLTLVISLWTIIYINGIISICILLLFEPTHPINNHHYYYTKPPISDPVCHQTSARPLFLINSFFN